MNGKQQTHCRSFGLSGPHQDSAGDGEPKTSLFSNLEKCLHVCG